MTARPPASLATARRIVIKVGSALLVEPESGAVRRAWLDRMIDDVAGLHRAGKQVVIVSSGAIAVGRRLLRLTAQTPRLEEKQAAAATGQIRLAHAYQESLARYGITVALVLLSTDDTEQRRRHLNARATLDTLLGLNAIPVINENDTITTADIRFGDNDRLAARVAQMIGADLLVLLTDIDGLYDRDPRRHADARHIAEVAAITPEIEAMAGQTINRDGTGGMVTKLEAARIAMGAGCPMVISDGTADRPVAAVDGGGRRTWFLPATSPPAARKRWIAGSLRPTGALHLDAGAVRALNDGSSLLPAGVTAVDGRFERGDLVSVHAPDGREVARGLIAYSAGDAARIMGHNTREIEPILGYRGREEMIHRDDLVLT